MAAKQHNMHQGGIVERRLRPIYDWLDNGNNKKALQEAEKLLKKSPLQAVRALKALALLRLGRAEEAQAVLDALAKEKPSSDNTLQAMTISYRESQQLHKICEIYEAAVKEDPTSEELQSHLFMSYVRVGDYKQQQRSAMALYKFAPKNPYYFWAVMSFVLQAKSEEDDAKKGILLRLAQKMIDKFIAENKMEAEQEARLYIMILELQEKWEEILQFIESPLYSNLVPGTIAPACIPYLKKLGQWKRINLLCKDLLWDNQDRWDYYMPYFDSVFQLMKGVKDENNDASVDDTAEKCHEFICQLVESMSSGRTLRGPYLARLELWRRLKEDGDPTALLGSAVALCLQYLRVFAKKPCAVPDLKPYLSMISQKEREGSSREFLTCLGFDENSEPDQLDDIQSHISCIAAWRLTAAPLSPDGNLALAHSLRRQYLRCLHNGLNTSTVTEFCATEFYAVIAAHHYFYAAVQQQSSAPVIEAVCLLELVLHHSPSNSHAKLLLITLYHLLGNPLAADAVYQRLEVKHVQLVSLGWLHCARLAGAPARALQLLADTAAFHNHHAKDSVEHLTYAYKYGTFEKLVELYSWRARLENCLWSALAARERALLSLLGGPPALLHAPARLPHAPADNRDLNVIQSYEPPQNQDPELQSRTFEQDIAYLRLKDGLVSAIALCIECTDNRPLEERLAQYEELKTCVDAFDSAMKICKEKYCEKEKISLCSPFPCRIIAFVNSPVPYRELYVTWLRLVAELCAGRAQQARALCDVADALLQTARAALRDEARAVHFLGARSHLLHGIGDYLQFIGIITFLIGVCNEVIAPVNTKKSKKKTNQSPEDFQTIELINKLNENVQESISSLEDIYDEMPEYEFKSTLEEEFSKLNIDQMKYHNTVEENFKKCEQSAINDVKNILKKKTKYLKSLIQ